MVDREGAVGVCSLYSVPYPSSVAVQGLRRTDMCCQVAVGTRGAVRSAFCALQQVADGYLVVLDATAEAKLEFLLLAMVLRSKSSPLVCSTGRHCDENTPTLLASRL